MIKISKISLKSIIFLFIISFLVIFLFSIGTSPFFGNYYTSDSSIFITVGKAMKSGKILYKEIFDHKGPILFLIQMIGQYISDGRIGIFIIEIFSLFITNIFLYKTINIFTSNKKALISVCISMIFMSYFIETGNYSEEYSLPFIAICLYLCIKWLKSKNPYSNAIFLYSFIYGICFSIIAFIRLNNALLICGLALAITIIFIKEKNIKKLIMCGISLIIGIFVVALPILLYFYKVDALYDMLYGTFIHNFMYINSSIKGNISIIAKLLIIFIITLMLLLNLNIYKKDKKISLIFIMSYISTLIATSIGPGFNNYYIIAIPIISIFIIPIVEIFCSKSMNKIFKIFILSYICLIFVIGCFIPQLNYKINFKNTNLENIKSFIYDNVSVKDRNNILAIGLFTAPVYLYSDILPCYKYAFMQDYLFVSNNKIMEETYNFIKNGDVKYIVCKDLDALEKKDYLQEFIFNKYTKKDSLVINEQNQLKDFKIELVLYELNERT